MNLEQISRERTLIVVRGALTEVKMILAGAILEFFSTKFKAPMAEVSAEIAPSHSLGCLDSVSIIGIRGSCERTVRREGCKEGFESQ